MLEPETHKENPEEIDDNDDDNDNHIDHALISSRKMGSSEKTFIHKDNVRTILEKVDNTLKEVVPKMVTMNTDGVMKDNLPWLMVDVVKKESESKPKLKFLLLSLKN
ncbi:hypothetical protein Tco_1188471, partial [Tanacetum coccineum]